MAILPWARPLPGFTEPARWKETNCMKTMSRWTAWVLAVVIAAGLIAATHADASPAGTRNTALATTAVTGYFLYKYAQKPSTKRAIPAAVAAAGTYYAWQQANKSLKAEKAAQRSRQHHWRRKR